MPELPEVEHLRCSLLPVLVGLHVHAVHLARTDIIEKVSDAGIVVTSRRSRKAREQSDPPDSSALLVGSRITSLERRGKQLFICSALDEQAPLHPRVLGVHLGMSGQLYFVPAGSTSPVKAFASGTSHIHARWTLHNAQGNVAGELCFRDPRRFGALTLFPNADSMQAWLARSLGPDALVVQGDHLFAALHRSSRMLKAALLDQGVVAGIGNIYADEALFRARIRPQLRCCRLTLEQANELAMHLRALLAQAVAAGGSTLRDYVDGLGNTGNAQHMHAVYGRAGKPCPVCAGILKGGTVAQRTTVWCSGCQGNRRNARLDH